MALRLRGSGRETRLWLLVSVVREVCRCAAEWQGVASRVREHIQGENKDSTTDSTSLISRLTA